MSHVFDDLIKSLQHLKWAYDSGDIKDIHQKLVAIVNVDVEHFGDFYKCAIKL